MFFLLPSGPEIKKPNTSLNLDPTYSRYSSEAKTYLKDRFSEVVTKSNSNCVFTLTLEFGNGEKKIKSVYVFEDYITIQDLHGRFSDNRSGWLHYLRSGPGGAGAGVP